MRVVVAIDSFKGSLTSVEAGQAIKDGILRVARETEVLVCPIADGGEGTVAALVHGMNGVIRKTEVTGPLGEPVVAEWGILDGKTAVIEMAAAAGLTLVEPAKRNPLYTTTYGVGELIGEAIRVGCRHFIVGIGGSATNDGGVGMLEALGFRFCDEAGCPIPRGAIGLASLRTIHYDNVNPQLKDCTFRIVCDVQNPLCGPNGCSYVFAPQKGAGAGQVEEMDAWLRKYAQIVGSQGDPDMPGAEKHGDLEKPGAEKHGESGKPGVGKRVDPDMPGAGAAGGLGFAFSAFTNAKLERGIDIIMDETGLEAKIRDADLVITGEGRIDEQTYMGKAPAGVAALAGKCGKRVIAFCGCATEAAKDCRAHGIDAVYSTMPEGMSLEEAMEKTKAMENLASKVEEVFSRM